MESPRGQGRGDDEGRKDLSNLAESYRKAAPYMSASTQLVGAVGLCTWLGIWLDRKLGNEVPWLTMLGAAVGMTAGFIGFFKTVLGRGKKNA